MAITITGSKASGTVVSYASKQLTISGATLVSGDYSDQRIVGVWTSGGAYRGMTWVRRFISSTVLEMEFDFIDKDGSTITPVSGDTFQVSNNFADVVTTGLSLAANIVSQSDNIIFGTAGVSNSACFYDEDKRINITNDNNNFPYRFDGGLFVLGHLLNYEERTFFNPVDLYSSGGGSGGNQLRVNNLNAKVWWMGGKLQFAVTPARVPGGAGGNPAEWQKWWEIETNCDLVTPGGGAAWSSNAANQQFVNCGSLVSSTDAIGFRLADSDTQGGFCKISGGSVISAFGSDAAGSFTVAAPTGERFNVFDIGTNLSKTAFWRSDGGVSQAITIKNVISTDFRLGQGGSPGSNQNTNAVATVNFSGRYSNALASTKVIIRETNNVAIADSGTSVSGENLDLSVKYADVTGHTLTVHETDFGWAAMEYESSLIFGVFAVEDVETLDGTAKDIIHGGALAQSTDILITETTKAAVDAYTTIGDAFELYDRAKAYLYDNYAGETSTLISRAGAQAVLAAVDLVIDATAVSAFVYSATGDGTITVKSSTFTGGATATSGEVTLSNGALLNGGTFDAPINIDDDSDTDTYTNITATKIVHSGTGTRTLTLDGANCAVDEIEVTGGADLTITLTNGAATPITTETSGTITLTQNVDVTNINLINGSRVQLYNTSLSAEIDNSVISGGSGYSYTLDLLGAEANDGDTLRIRGTWVSGATAKGEYEETSLVTTNGLSFIGTQVSCPIYENWGLSGSTITKFIADYIDDEVDIVVNDNFELSELGAWWKYNLTTQQGISDFYGGLTFEDEANLLIHNDIVDIYLDNTTSGNVHQTDNRRLYRDDLTRPVNEPTTGGGGIDVEWRSPVSLANTDKITADLEIINTGVQKASKSIPHSTNLT